MTPKSPTPKYDQNYLYLSKRSKSSNLAQIMLSVGLQMPATRVPVGLQKLVARDLVELRIPIA